MVKVTIGTNMGVKEVIFEKATSFREALESQGLSYQNAQIFLGGSPVTTCLDMTFADFNVGDTCMLTCTVKADGGR